jgi:hypothetical protein
MEKTEQESQEGTMDQPMKMPKLHNMDGDEPNQQQNDFQQLFSEYMEKLQRRKALTTGIAA